MIRISRMSPNSPPRTVQMCTPKPSPEPRPSSLPSTGPAPRREWSTTTTRADIRPPKPSKEPSRFNQMRRFYKGKYRQAMIGELVNNPVLCETVPREIEELMEAARERRRKGNGQDDSATQPQQQPT